MIFNDMNDLLPTFEDLVLPAELDVFVHKRVAGMSPDLFSQDIFFDGIGSVESSILGKDRDNSLKKQLSPKSYSFEELILPPTSSLHRWSKTMMYPLSRTHVRCANLSHSSAENSLISFLDSFQNEFSYQYVHEEKYWSCTAICTDKCKAASFHLRLFHDIDTNDIIFEFQRRTGCSFFSINYFKALKSFVERGLKADPIKDQMNQLQQQSSLSEREFVDVSKFTRPLLPEHAAEYYSWKSYDCDSVSLLRNLLQNDPFDATNMICSMMRQRSQSAPPSSFSSDLNATNDNIMFVKENVLHTNNFSQAWEERKPKIAAAVCESICTMANRFSSPNCLFGGIESAIHSIVQVEDLAVNNENLSTHTDIIKSILEERAQSEATEIALAMTCLTAVLATNVNFIGQPDLMPGNFAVFGNNDNDASSCEIGSELDLQDSLESILPTIKKTLNAQSFPHRSFHRQCASKLVEQIMQSGNLSMPQRIHFISTLN